eukprot:TRINITY_DN8483_c0_g1_i3.p1 TRINITY_DN8483_c0_g1~~TRINITY_DN8483_c0_g1_i3.p1  ORF type:complete len:702 (+),score=163.70 TRINITY_DN8483_c0_g1_i3:64-2169(+)
MARPAAKSKRILQELAKLRAEPNKDFDAGPLWEEDPFFWEVSLKGAKGSPYEDGVFFLELDLSDGYPFKPPTIMFKTPIYHCNLSLAVKPNRRTAEHFLRWEEDWHPSINVQRLVGKIQALMSEPFADLAFEGPALDSDPKPDTCKGSGLSLSIGTLSGQSLTVNGGADDLVENVMAVVARKTQVSCARFRLKTAACGQELSLHRSLSECQLEDGAKLLMVPWIRKRLETALVDEGIATLFQSDREQYLKLARSQTQQHAVTTLPLQPQTANALSASSSVSDSKPKQQMSTSSSSSTAAGGYPSSASSKEEIHLNCGADQNSHEHSNLDDDAEPSLPCPLCGVHYKTDFLEMHLEGHFAFDACTRTQASDVAGASGSSSSSSSTSAGTDALQPTVSTDAKVAEQLQELENMLSQCRSLASERLAACLATAGQDAGDSSTAAEALPLSKSSLPDDLVAVQKAIAAGDTSKVPAHSLWRLQCWNEDAKLAARLAVEAEEEKIAHEQREEQAREAERLAAIEGPSEAKPQPKPQPQPKPKPKAAVRPPQVSNAPMRMVENAVLRYAQEKSNLSFLQAGYSAGEYEAVKDYFTFTLGARNVQIASIQRVNGNGFQRFRPGNNCRVMFHGCKVIENEERILKEGFQVSQCISGGRNYGTWFAFNAAYSDSGFAFNHNGVRHMFLCLVSDAEVMYQTPIMRVVGQDF